MTKLDRQIKRERKELIVKKRKKRVSWVCTKCKQEILIRITLGHEDLYTDERKKNFVCICCKGM